MKIAVPVVIVLIIAAACVLALSLGGRSGSAGPVAGTPRPADALGALAAAYRSNREINDHLKFQLTTEAGDNIVDYYVRLDDDDNVWLKLPDSTIVITHGVLNMSLDLIPHKYLEMDAAATPDDSFRALTSKPQIHLALRYSDDRSRQLDALTWELLNNPRMASEGPITLSDGTTRPGFVIQADNGTARILTDEKTGLLTGSVIEYELGSGQTLRVATQVAAGPPPIAPIGFTPGSRYRVETFPELQRCLPGQPAPDFTLETFDGQTVTLSGQRGSVVVLDFWATWCSPCKRGLPKLNEFHRWTETSGLPIKVYAVDVWERENMYPTAEAKRAAVEKYWRDAGFAMPALMDYSGAAAHPFSFSSIPTMIVIDPEGKIATVHSGYDENVVERLKAHTQALLDGGGA